MSTKNAKAGKVTVGVGVLLVVCFTLLSVGCRMISWPTKRNSTGKGTGFCCNCWKDLNNDGIPAFPDEFIGVKNTFRSNEKLMLVSMFDAPGMKGKKWTIKILAPDNREIEDSTLILPADFTVMRMGGGPEDDLTGWLMAAGGPGTYKVSWCLDGQPACFCEFKLTGPSRPHGRVCYILGTKENLAEIARRFDVKLESITRINHISNPNEIYAGQKLILWPDVVEHVVEKGEWLSKLARKYGTTVTAIRKINELKSDNLIVGQRLIIPVSSVR